MEKSHVGLIGLGVMGAHLARNLGDKRYTLSVYNRTAHKTEEFLKNYGSRYIQGFTDLDSFVESLELPRKIIVLVQAGTAVDDVIHSLEGLVSAGDIIMDFGNSHFRDTQKRCELLKKKEVHFMGCGISGGEEGALHGASIMPSGSRESWKDVSALLEAVSAKDFEGKPCATYVGENGAGHYVKMVHNGIEYAIMQLMAEVYDILRTILHFDALQVAAFFEDFNAQYNRGFLTEIAVHVLRQKDTFNDGHLIDFISDRAEQKGTGRWTVIDALERGVAVPTIMEAVNARIVSGDTQRRESLSGRYPSRGGEIGESDGGISALHDALYFGMIVSYLQGYDLMKKASADEKWNIDLSEIFRIWQGGCIIRSDFLKNMQDALKATRGGDVYMNDSIVKDLSGKSESVKKVLTAAIQCDVPSAALMSTLAHMNSVGSKRLPTHFIQGLRDFFGAHTYERTDRSGVFHAEWNR